MLNLTAFVVGGDGDFSYSWSPTTGLNDPLIANPTLTITDIPNLEIPTTVIRTVTITDGSGSSDTATVLIDIGCDF